MKKKRLSSLKAIRKHCLACSGDNAHEVRLCLCTDCLLYDFRFGVNPNLKGKGCALNLVSGGRKTTKNRILQPTSKEKKCL